MWSILNIAENIQDKVNMLWRQDAGDLRTLYSAPVVWIVITAAVPFPKLHQKSHPYRIPSNHLFSWHKLIYLKKRQNFCFYNSLKKIMFSILDKIPYSILIVIAVFMILAPFKPMPHVMEKLIMLKNGTLTRPVDIFDLIFHLIPTIILLLKIYRSVSK